MFLRSRRRHKRHGGVSHPGNPIGSAAERWPQQWHAWRCAAQNVTRAWNEWLAASCRERAELYHRYLCALIEEERAAVELQRAVSLDANPQGEPATPESLHHPDRSQR
jgi:hypothetical protein